MCCSLFALLPSFAYYVISDLKVTPIAPWGIVIDYSLDGATVDDADRYIAYVQVTVEDGVYEARNVLGNTKCENGAHRLYWNMAKDGITIDMQSAKVEVYYNAPYYVFDLSSGVSVSSCPVMRLAKEPEGGFNTDEYKTTKLVLKRVPPGTFIMGDNQSDVSHRVILTKPFYMGLFEVTGKQWELITETSNPSTGGGNTSPVNRVAYSQIRGSSEGTKWPRSNAVDGNTFMWRLRAATRKDFDLPTEAQWEYVCRAGTTKVYSYGDLADEDYMWYNKKSSGSTPCIVGSQKPNPWGFYDMHGNVWEYCLDYWGTLPYGTDPKGPSTGWGRILRGGSFSDDAKSCTSSYRYYQSYVIGAVNIGFRVVCPL